MIGAGPGTVLVVHPSVELYGADRMLVESVAALVESGWRAVVVVPGPGPIVGLLEGVGAEVVRVGSPVLRKASMSPSGLVRLMGALARSVPAVWATVGRSGARVVYVNTLTVPWWVVVARLRGLPVVCHVHEAEESVPGWVRKALVSPLVLARVVLANSEASRAVVVGELPGLGARTRVLYNGFDGPAEVVEPRVELSGPVRLVLVGRISPRKGTDVAVEAVRLLVEAGRDVRLDLVGGVFAGYEWFEEQVREQVQEAGEGGRVRWRGVMPDPWLALAGADVALVPSRVEPFGNTAVEAMLAMRPVVVSDAQGLREIVDPASDGELVVAGDAVSLAAGVERVLADWPAARARAVAVADRAAGRFSEGRYRSELVAAVAGAAEGNAPAQAPPQEDPESGLAAPVVG